MWTGMEDEVERKVYKEQNALKNAYTNKFNARMENRYDRKWWWIWCDCLEWKRMRYYKKNGEEGKSEFLETYTR